MATFPPNVGGEIPLDVAQERIQNFRSKYPDAPGSYNVPRGLIIQALAKSEEITGLRFGLGYGNGNRFAPIIGGSSFNGQILDTFSNRGPMNPGQYKEEGDRWKAEKPYDLNSVFMGRECLVEMVERFPGGSIEACVDLSDEGLSLCLIVSEPGGMKDNNGNQGAYNTGLPCPVFCPDDD